MSKIAKPKRLVIKIGSALLTEEGRGLCRERIEQWARQIATLSRDKIELAVVTSGAVAEGVQRLGWKERPNRIDQLQMAAAVGQIGLSGCWEHALSEEGVRSGQILLTREDLSDRSRYLNALAVLVNMFEVGVVPVINENDTVVTDEICMGDNDTLAGRVVNLINADLLLILTDQQGIFESDPRTNPDAALIERCDLQDKRLLKAASGGSANFGRGGARTKIDAAMLAARSGAATIVAHGLEDRVIERIGGGELIGTLIESSDGETPLSARKRWLAGLARQGSVRLDAGAARALTERGTSLLAVGIAGVEGKFQRGDVVSCVSDSGVEIACGLCNYNNEELSRIAGKASEHIEEVLGYSQGEEVIHRDNLILLKTAD